MKAYLDVDVQYEVNGLRILRETRDSTAQPMPHSHNEIELLLLERGSGSWLLGGELVTLKPGRLIVFWAVRPHQLIKSAPNTVINCLTIPLTVFNEWQLPERLSKALLAGQTLLESDLEVFNTDKRAFGQWNDDLHSQDRNRHKVALLEIEARLGRLAGRLPETPSASSGQALDLPSNAGSLNHQYFNKISQIADYVSKHFSEPLTVPDIAKAVNMHPTSATKMFKKICGINLIHYLTQHRILHAQRLLMTSDLKILDIALASGYRSASRFYAAYKKFCGMSPQRFRASVDLRKVPLERKTGVWRTGKVRQSAPSVPAQN